MSFQFTDFLTVICGLQENEELVSHKKLSYIFIII